MNALVKGALAALALIVAFPTQVGAESYGPGTMGASSFRIIPNRAPDVYALDCPDEVLAACNAAATYWNGLLDMAHAPILSTGPGHPWEPIQTWRVSIGDVSWGHEAAAEAYSTPAGCEITLWPEYAGNAQTMAHEVGHCLGLGDNPQEVDGLETYDGIMNYAHSYDEFEVLNATGADAYYLNEMSYVAGADTGWPTAPGGYNGRRMDLHPPELGNDADTGCEAMNEVKPWINWCE